MNTVWPQKEPKSRGASPESERNGAAVLPANADVAVLEQRVRELGDFLENAAVAMHWVADDGVILWANAAELKLLGYSSEEYVGHNIAEFYLDEWVIRDIMQRLQENEELHGYEARLRAKDGSVRYVSI